MRPRCGFRLFLDRPGVVRPAQGLLLRHALAGSLIPAIVSVVFRVAGNHPFFIPAHDNHIKLGLLIVSAEGKPPPGQAAVVIRADIAAQLLPDGIILLSELAVVHRSLQRLPGGIQRGEGFVVLGIRHRLAIVDIVAGLLHVQIVRAAGVGIGILKITEDFALLIEGNGAVAQAGAGNVIHVPQMHIGGVGLVIEAVAAIDEIRLRHAVALFYVRVGKGGCLLQRHIALAGQDVAGGQIGVKAVIQADLRGLGLDLQRPFVAVAVLIPQGGDAVHEFIVLFPHAGLNLGKMLGHDAVHQRLRGGIKGQIFDGKEAVMLACPHLIELRQASQHLHLRSLGQHRDHALVPVAGGVQAYLARGRVGCYRAGGQGGGRARHFIGEGQRAQRDPGAVHAGAVLCCAHGDFGPVDQLCLGQRLGHVVAR